MNREKQLHSYHNYVMMQFTVSKPNICSSGFPMVTAIMYSITHSHRPHPPNMYIPTPEMVAVTVPSTAIACHEPLESFFFGLT